MFRQATGREHSRAEQADVDTFRAGLDPIARAGKLGVLLAQFPPSFKSGSDSRDYLAWLLSTFSDHSVRGSSYATGAGVMMCRKRSRS